MELFSNGVAIRNSIMGFIIGILMWWIAGLILGSFEPVILDAIMKYPKWMTWYPMFRQIYYWFPLFIIIATVLNMFINSKPAANTIYG